MIKVIPLLVYQVKDLQQLKHCLRDTVATVTQNDFYTGGQRSTTVWLLVMPPRVPALIPTRVVSSKNA